MCKYCDKPKECEEQANDYLMDKDLKNEVGIILEIDKDKLCLMVDNGTYYKDDKLFSKADDFVSKKINYCPMCGERVRK